MTPRSNAADDIGERALEVLARYTSSIDLPRASLPGRSAGRGSATRVGYETLTRDQKRRLNELITAGDAFASTGVLDPEVVAEELVATLGLLRIHPENRVVERSRLTASPRVLAMALTVTLAGERTARLGVLRTDGTHSEIDTQLVGSGSVDHRLYESLRFTTNLETSHRIEVSPVGGSFDLAAVLKVAPAIDPDVAWIDVTDGADRTVRVSFLPPLGDTATVSTGELSLAQSAQATLMHFARTLLMRYRQLHHLPPFREALRSAPFDPLGIDGGSAAVRALAELGLLDGAGALEDDIAAILEAFSSSSAVPRLSPRLDRELQELELGAGRTGAVALGLELPVMRHRSLSLEALLGWDGHFEVTASVEPGDATRVAGNRELRSFAWSAEDDTGRRYVGSASTRRVLRHREEIDVGFAPGLASEATMLRLYCQGGTEHAAIELSIAAGFDIEATAS